MYKRTKGRHINDKMYAIFIIYAIGVGKKGWCLSRDGGEENFRLIPRQICLDKLFQKYNPPDSRRSLDTNRAGTQSNPLDKL